jgi:hypothetical protein
MPLWNCIHQVVLCHPDPCQVLHHCHHLFDPCRQALSNCRKHIPCWNS